MLYSVCCPGYLFNLSHPSLRRLYVMDTPSALFERLVIAAEAVFDRCENSLYTVTVLP